MKQSRLKLRENYDKACDAYLRAFCEKHDFDYAEAARSWVGGDVGGITECADYCVSMSDIITDIDLDAPEEEYVKYYDYSLRVHSVANGELTVPNYASWLRGCPRMSEEQIQRLEELQQDIRKAESALKAEIDRTNEF